MVSKLAVGRKLWLGCQGHMLRVARSILSRGEITARFFYCEADYSFYLQKLREASERYSVRVHAFVLMTNYVHLLVTPSDAEGVPRMMQSLGRCCVRYVNITYRRTGTLWEGRYRSCLVSSDDYF